MATINNMISEFSECGCLERVRYFPRQLITAVDMLDEQNYFLEKLRRHNRFIHGWGIVCGLSVKAAATTALPWQAAICPGYALSAFGDEIYLGKEQSFDLATCLFQPAECSPCDRSIHDTAALESKNKYIVIKYAECKTRPQRTMPAGCGCDETVCEYSRIRDGFEIICLPMLPKSHDDTFKELEAKNKNAGLCPPCPPDPWLVLARVEIPDGINSKIENSMIKTDDRRMLQI
jgi:hypothetical protein